MAVLVGNKSHDKHGGPTLVILDRRSQVRSTTATAHNTIPDESQGPGSIHTVDTDGETVVQIEGLGRADSNVTLSRKCLISLNWPAET